MAVAVAMMLLSESMMREISPPDATSAIFCNALFLFAEKRKATLSAPVLSG